MKVAAPLFSPTPPQPAESVAAVFAFRVLAVPIILYKFVRTAIQQIHFHPIYFWLNTRVPANIIEIILEFEQAGKNVCRIWQTAYKSSVKRFDCKARQRFQIPSIIETVHGKSSSHYLPEFIASFCKEGFQV